MSYHNTPRYGNNSNYADPYSEPSYGRAGDDQYYPSPAQTDHTAQPYIPNPSTEKIIDEYPAAGTERAQPGRQGIRHGQSKSWAEVGPPPRSTGILRMWRKDERGRQWTRGGGLRSSCRMICCCLTITLILVISIILAILLFIRPPRVSLQGVNLGSNPVSLTSSGLSLSFTVGISVNNPNWFNVDFSTIEATASYPGVSGDLGGGTLHNVNFAGHKEVEFDFPFVFNYTLSADPNQVILKDLISKCGTVKEDLTIDYDLDMTLKILGVSVNPKISSSASFTCPISASDLEGILGSDS